jgi:hypothetical protein
MDAIDVTTPGGAVTGKDVMAMIALIIGSVALIVTGFVAWYTVWHRRVESSFERLPVRTGRSGHVLRQGVELERDSE